MEIEDIDFVRIFRHIRNENGIGDIAINDAVSLIKQYLIDNHTMAAGKYNSLAIRACRIMIEIGMLKEIVVNRRTTAKYRLVDIHGV